MTSVKTRLPSRKVLPYSDQLIYEANGDPYSIEKMDADGLEIQDDYSLEDEVVHRMLNEALHNAVDELPQVDREIIILYANKVGTREIAKKVHMPQSTVSYREKIILKQLRNKLKYWK